MDIRIRLQHAFRARFGEEAITVRSPGRINLIGEHTDYNMGLVLPAAIDKHIWLSLSARQDDVISLYATDFNQEEVVSLDRLSRSDSVWPNYVLGVIDQFVKLGYALPGLNIVFTGDIPKGGGMSSSAALGCAAAFAINEFFSFGLTKMDIARLAQASENEFVGVKVGLMDQFASVFGKKDCLVKLDCRNELYEYIPFTDPSVSLVLLDSRVKHTHLNSAYNERRQQCEEGVQMISKKFPEVASLRDATEYMLETTVKANSLIYNRCLYVVQEMERLERGIEDLRTGNFTSFGRRMFQTHDGLKNLYETSCSELDLLVDLARSQKGISGARMMGGGFGGCTINLVETCYAEQAVASIKDAYFELLGFEPHVYPVRLEEGTSIIEAA